MATQTVLSPPSQTLQEVEKEEAKKMEDCPPPKESGAECEAKTEEAAVIKEDDQQLKSVPPLAEAKVDVAEDSLILDKCAPQVAIPAAESTVEKETQKQDDDTNVVEKPEEPEQVVYVPKPSPSPDVTIPEAECTPQQQSVPAPVVEDKIPEVELKTPAHELEDTNLSQKKETCVVETSDEANPEAPTIQLEEKCVDSNPIVEQTERAKDTDEVTGQSEQKGVEPGTKETGVVVAEELVPCEEKATDGAKDAVEETGVDTGKNETGVAEEKSVVAEELVPCEEKAPEDAKDEAVSREVEPDCDDKGSKGEESTEKVDEKIEKTVEATDVKEEEKQVNEGVQNEECGKDSEDVKTYEDVRKEDVRVKKQSFVKIMKQSLVKAKKAIIGKSQNPKTPASEVKDDGNK